MMSPKTPSPRRSKSLQPTALTCTCKAGYCAAVNCFACRKCCQLHNSRLKLGKEKRAIGRPKRDDERQKPLPATDRHATAAELQRAAMADVNYAGLLTPLTMPKKATAPPLAKLLEFLGHDDETTARLCKHLPPRNLRSATTFWQQRSDCDEDPAHVSQRLAVMRLYGELLFNVASSVCGSEEAAALSLETFAMWLSPDPTKPSHQAVARSCLRAIATAKKGSTERRLVRATLCGTFKRQDLDALGENMPDAKIGHSTYHASRNDFARLLQGDQLPKATWSRKRFDSEAVSRAIEFILAYENVAYVSWARKRSNFTSVSAAIQQRTYLATVILSTVFIVDQRRGPTAKELDYVTGFLVYDALGTLREVVMAVSPRTAEAINCKLDVLQAWLMYGHAAAREGADDSRGCPRHDVAFGLATPGHQDPMQSRTHAVDNAPVSIDSFRTSSL